MSALAHSEVQQIALDALDGLGYTIVHGPYNTPACCLASARTLTRLC